MKRSLKKRSPKTTYACNMDNQVNIKTVSSLFSCLEFSYYRFEFSFNFIVLVDSKTYTSNYCGNMKLQLML